MQLRMVWKRGCKKIQLIDGKGIIIDSTASILERLRKFRMGTQIDVNNVTYEKYSYNPKVMFYLVYNDEMRAVYVICSNLSKCTCDIVGMYCNNSIRYDKLLSFSNVLEKIYGKLTIINDGAADRPPRQAYCVVHNPLWKIARDDELYAKLLADSERVIVMANGKIRMPKDALKYKMAREYRNTSGDCTKKIWMTLSEAIGYAMHLSGTYKGVFLVCSKDNVLFAINAA